jgi:8-oxo-dGTP pyrophosphatase MutT (NUDIX family)
LLIVTMVTIETIRRFLETYVPKSLDDRTLTRAGILMPFVGFPENPLLLLTKRTDRVEHHKGQVSFPGGAVDGTDVDIVATALRESQEEIGLPSSVVEVLGQFDDFWTPTGFIITPVVGYVRELPPLILSPEEVETVLCIPVSFFLDKSNERRVKLERNGKLYDVYSYHYDNTEIWGATAAIIRSFLIMVRDYQT